MKSLDFVLSMVSAERARQISKGYDAAHDAKHTEGELGAAAAAFLLPKYIGLEYKRQFYPWVGYYKAEPNRVLELVKGITMAVAEAQRLLAAPEFGLATKLVVALNADNNSNFQVSPENFLTLASGIKEMLAAGCEFTDEQIDTLATEGENALDLMQYPGYGVAAEALEAIFAEGSDPHAPPFHYDATDGVPQLAAEGINAGKPVSGAEAQEAASKLLAAFNAVMGISVSLPAEDFEALTVAVGRMQRAGFEFTEEAIAEIAEKGAAGAASKAPGWQELVSVFQGHINRAEAASQAETPDTGAPVSPSNPGGGNTGMAPNGNPMRAPDEFYQDEPRPGAEIGRPDQKAADLKAFVQAGVKNIADPSPANQAAAEAAADTAATHYAGPATATATGTPADAAASDGNAVEATPDGNGAPKVGGPADSATERKAAAVAPAATKGASDGDTGKPVQRGPGRPPVKR